MVSQMLRKSFMPTLLLSNRGRTLCSNYKCKLRRCDLMQAPLHLIVSKCTCRHERTGDSTV